MDKKEAAFSETPATPEQMASALFAQMILQQANMALMLLGKIANPQTGEMMRDIEAAQYFISQLEMLEIKTKGNLSKDEENLLKQSLLTLRMTYVEVTQSPEPPKAEAGKPVEPAKPAEEKKPAEPAAPSGHESEKKFTKKY